MLGKKGMFRYRSDWNDPPHQRVARSATEIAPTEGRKGGNMGPTHCIAGSRRLFGQRASNPQAASLLVFAVAFSCVGLSMLLSYAPAHAQTDTAAAAQSSLSIAIFVSSRNDRCFDSGRWQPSTI